MFIKNLNNFLRFWNFKKIIKNILTVTNHFYPESFKVNDIVFSLSKEEYKTTVVTVIPNYPEGKIYQGYKNYLL